MRGDVNRKVPRLDPAMTMDGVVEGRWSRRRMGGREANTLRLVST